MDQADLQKSLLYSNDNRTQIKGELSKIVDQISEIERQISEAPKKLEKLKERKSQLKSELELYVYGGHRKRSAPTKKNPNVQPNATKKPDAPANKRFS